MSDTLEARRAASARGRGRGGATGPGQLTLNLSQPAPFSAGAFQAQQQAQAAPGALQPSTSGTMGRGGGLVGQPFINTSAMLGISQPTMVAARPSAQQQQAVSAARIAQQLEAFGIAAVVAPDNQDNADLVLKNHGFGDEDGGDQILANFMPKRGLMRCFVRRERTGVISTTQKFYMCVEQGERFVLGSRKRQNKQTSNYILSRSADDMERESPHFHGKLRANFTGLDFVIYDNGENPEKATTSRPARQELGAVLYDANIAGTKGPRKMQVVLPRRKEDGQPEVWQPRTEADSIVTAYRNDPNSERFIVLVNKEPTWNEQLRSYQLNFHGRVTKASVKNFQLVDRRNPNRVVMQFGKRDDDIFSLDFQAPLTATQAFSIALTAFDNKIACE